MPVPEQDVLLDEPILQAEELLLTQEPPGLSAAAAAAAATTVTPTMACTTNTTSDDAPHLRFRFAQRAQALGTVRAGEAGAGPQTRPQHVGVEARARFDG